MQIKLQHNGKLLRSIIVNPTSKVADLKKKIQVLEKLPPEQQVLTFGGYVLEDDNSLSVYDIQSEAIISLFFRMGFRSPYQVHVQVPDGKTFNIKVTETQTVEELKRHVELMSGLDAASFSLIYKQISLEDKRRLHYYEIKDNSFMKAVINAGEYESTQPLQLSKKAWVSFLSQHGRPIILEVNVNSSISQTRDKIAKMLGTPGKFLQFQFAGDLLDVRKTFSECQIGDGDRVFLIRKYSPPCRYSQHFEDEEDEQHLLELGEKQGFTDFISLMIQTKKNGTLLVKTYDDIPFGRIRLRLERETKTEQTNLFYKDVLLGDKETPWDYNMSSGTILLQS